MKKKKPGKKQTKKIVPAVPKQVFSRWHMAIIAALAFLMYLNTFGHDYTQDDAIVITENMYTQQGIEGIPGLLTKDTFFGFFKVEGKEKLVAGGRYRPLTPIMFALEKEIFGDKAALRHIINTLLYALLCVVLYRFIIVTFKNVLPASRLPLFALLAALAFALHPIHTEAVANIKGRDEIMSMLLGFSSILYLLSNAKKKFLNFFLAGSLFFLALMSKENAITLIPVAFLIFYLLQKKPLKESITATFPIIAGTLLFLAIRFSVVGFDITSPTLEMMNNPFVKFENGSYSFFSTSEKLASIIFVLGWYIKLLFLPHPLTNDYYPRQVEVMGLEHPYVIISLLALISVTALGFWFWKRNRLVSFSVFYFLFTISIFSNILFPIGTHLSERFLFMPSLGFCLLLAYVLWNIYYKFGSYVFGGLCVLIIGLYGFKTITRNMVWKDNFTLYSTDVKVSNNSAKALNAAGGVLVSSIPGVNDGAKKAQMLNDALVYLNKATSIHPNYKNAWLLTGNAKFYMKDYDDAISAFERALAIDPGYNEALGNLAIVLREAGRHAGETLKDIAKSKVYLLRSYQLNSNDYETVGLLGVTESISGNHGEAIKYYKKSIALSPNNVRGYMMLSRAYSDLGDVENAQLYRTKALEIDINAFK